MKPYENAPKGLVNFDGEITDIPLLNSKFHNTLQPRGWKKFKRENDFFKNYTYSCPGIMIYGNLYDRKIVVQIGPSRFTIQSVEDLRKYFKSKFNIDL
jgi:hypothetical protein